MISKHFFLAFLCYAASFQVILIAASSPWTLMDVEKGRRTAYKNAKAPEENTADSLIALLNPTDMVTKYQNVSAAGVTEFLVLNRAHFLQPRTEPVAQPAATSGKKDKKAKASAAAAPAPAPVVNIDNLSDLHTDNIQTGLDSLYEDITAAHFVKHLPVFLDTFCKRLYGTVPEGKTLDSPLLNKIKAFKLSFQAGKVTIYTYIDFNASEDKKLQARMTYDSQISSMFPYFNASLSEQTLKGWMTISERLAEIADEEMSSLLSQVSKAEGTLGSISSSFASSSSKPESKSKKNNNKKEEVKSAAVESPEQKKAIDYVLGERAAEAAKTVAPTGKNSKKNKSSPAASNTVSVDSEEQKVPEKDPEQIRMEREEAERQAAEREAKRKEREEAERLRKEKEAEAKREHEKELEAKRLEHEAQVARQKREEELEEKLRKRAEAEIKQKQKEEAERREREDFLAAMAAKRAKKEAEKNSKNAKKQKQKEEAAPIQHQQHAQPAPVVAKTQPKAVTEPEMKQEGDLKKKQDTKLQSPQHQQQAQPAPVVPKTQQKTVVEPEVKQEKDRKQPPQSAVKVQSEFKPKTPRKESKGFNLSEQPVIKQIEEARLKQEEEDIKRQVAIIEEKDREHLAEIHRQQDLQREIYLEKEAQRKKEAEEKEQKQKELAAKRREQELAAQKKQQEFAAQKRQQPQQKQQKNQKQPKQNFNSKPQENEDRKLTVSEYEEEKAREIAQLQARLRAVEEENERLRLRNLAAKSSESSNTNASLNSSPSSMDSHSSNGFNSPQAAYSSPAYIGAPPGLSPLDRSNAIQIAPRLNQQMYSSDYEQQFASRQLPTNTLSQNMMYGPRPYVNPQAQYQQAGVVPQYHQQQFFPPSPPQQLPYDSLMVDTDFAGMNLGSSYGSRGSQGSNFWPSAPNSGTGSMHSNVGFSAPQEEAFFSPSQGSIFTQGSGSGFFEDDAYGDFMPYNAAQAQQQSFAYLNQPQHVDTGLFSNSFQFSYPGDAQQNIMQQHGNDLALGSEPITSALAGIFVGSNNQQQQGAQKDSDSNEEENQYTLF